MRVSSSMSKVRHSHSARDNSHRDSPTQKSNMKQQLSHPHLKNSLRSSLSNPSQNGSEDGRHKPPTPRRSQATTPVQISGLATPHESMV